MVSELYYLFWERAFSYGTSFSPTVEIAAFLIALHVSLLFAIKGVEIRSPILAFSFVDNHAAEIESAPREVGRWAYLGWVLIFVLQVFFYKMPVFNLAARRASLPMILTASVFLLGAYFTLGWAWVFWKTFV